MNKQLAWPIVLGIASVITACGKHEPEPPPTSPTYTVGGTVAALTSPGLVLQVNGANNISVAAGATAFTSTNSLASGVAYVVTVLSQPSNQTCTVANGSGTVATSNVSNIAVSCVTSPTAAFTVGGAVSGLTSSGLVLQVNGANNLSVASGATSFTSSNTLTTGLAYSVTVLTQPVAQVCSVANGSGTVASTNVTSVAITCVTPPPLAYTIGGSITGLASSGLVLQVNGANNITVASGATTFTSINSLATGATYVVTVLTQPATQTCTVASGSGTIASVNVTNIAVSCVSTYTVGVTVSQYTGTGLVLQLNGGNNLTPVAASSALQLFGPRLLTNAPYAITVLSQPTSPEQQCTVANGSGTITDANITNVTVTCAPVVHLSGNVAGLTGTLGLQVQLTGVNAPPNQSITVQPGATAFTMSMGLIADVSFRVNVVSQPAGQTCLITRGAGLTGNADIVGITVTCAGNLTTPLSGTYQVTGEPGITFAFNTDGTYVMFYRDNDDGCINDDGQLLNTIEYGTYNWNSTTGLFKILNAPVDQSGECGLNDPTEPNIYGAQLVKSGNTLGLVSNDPNDPWSGSMTAVPSTTSTLIGSFRGISGGFMAFYSDGTYMLTTTQGRPDGAANNSTFAGVEHGCYNISGSNLTFNLSSSCVLPNGLPPVDTSGNAGFMVIGQTTRTLPFSVNGDTFTLGEAPNSVSYQRILVNAVTPPPSPPAGTFLVTGTISGLSSSGLLLQINGGNDLPVASGATSFSFSNVALATGVPFAVSVRTNPTGPALHCTVTNGSGTMGSANVTNVAITCAVPTTFTVSGTVEGLTGTLQVGLFTAPTATETLTLQSGTTSFTYSTQLATGTGFGTAITAQPVGQTCIVTRSSGLVATSDLSGTLITCVANSTSPLAGTYSGMLGSTFVALNFEADGRYLMVLREPDATDCRNSSGQLTSNGIEYGVYNWNSGTGAFRALQAVIDTTGDCGFVDSGGSTPFQGTLTRNGNSIVIAFTDDNGAPVSFALTSGPNASGLLAGTYGLPNGRLYMFFGDGTYITTQPQDRMNGAPVNASLIGFEHGCYSIPPEVPGANSLLTYNFSNTCVLPSGKPAIDLNGSAPLKSGPALVVPIPYVLNSDTLVLYTQTPFAFTVYRILGN